MKSTEAMVFDRKSGGAEGPAVRLSWMQLPHDNRLRVLGFEPSAPAELPILKRTQKYRILQMAEQAAEAISAGRDGFSVQRCYLPFLRA
jgi:hypothetical protein